MKSLENLDKVKRILVWNRRLIGYINPKKVGFFKKKEIIKFVSRRAGYWDCKFKSQGELYDFISKHDLIREDDKLYEKWSIDLIYSYDCSKTIYFNSKTSQNDWLESNCGKNYICVEDDKLM